MAKLDATHIPRRLKKSTAEDSPGRIDADLHFGSIQKSTPANVKRPKQGGHNTLRGSDFKQILQPCPVKIEIQSLILITMIAKSQLSQKRFSARGKIQTAQLHTHKTTQTRANGVYYALYPFGATLYLSRHPPQHDRNRCQNPQWHLAKRAELFSTTTQPGLGEVGLGF